MAEDKVNYAFVKGDPTVSPLLLLHGQGGDENDLLPIGSTSRQIVPCCRFAVACKNKA